MGQLPDFALLKALGIEELQKHWQAGGGSGFHPLTKWLLVREIAWRSQAQAHGGLEAETHRKLRAAVRSARIDLSGSRGVTTNKSRPCPGVKLPNGAKLVRTWRGQKHEVTVLEYGRRYSYQGESFKSLTKIAERITSAHWSGPRFFGLHRVRGVS
jgi:DUF2924 family protein